MKQVVQNARSRDLEVLDVPDPVARPGTVVVRNAASLISAGTERTDIDFARKSVLEKARGRPDLVKQVLDQVRQNGIRPTIEAVLNRLDQPIALGYSCAGVVERIGRGAEEFSVGDRVACAGQGYASHAELVTVPKNLVVPVPDGVSFDAAAYVTLGAIALQGVRVADVRLGESVAVIGLGLLGQLTVQILKAGGCRVMGIDLDPDKVSRALKMGADAAVARGDDPAAAVADFTDGVGVDAVVVTAATASNDPIELAGELCRDRGVVSMVGAVRMDLPRPAFYGKELELRLSRSYGPGRYDPEYEEKGHDYPIGYVRWTERRNMQAFLELVASGGVTPERLHTHRFSVEEAGRAYRIVTGEDDEPFLGILLEYPEKPAEPNRVTRLRKPRRRRRSRPGIGFIGAGSFARSVLLPRFSRGKAADMVGVATATGLSAQTTAKTFGFGYATTDISRLLDDDRLDAVVIATRHDSHADFAARALSAGTAVFVEKPLALSEEELQRVMEAQAESGALLTVGFNRRFSPLARDLKAALPADAPLAINYRINAGAIPADHWIQDPEAGGGRMIGEVCHFIDLAQFITGSEPVEVFAHGLGGPTRALHDTVAVTLRFADGSVATVSYFATGDKSLPKERVEVFAGGVAGVLDDFRALTVYRNGKPHETRPRRQEKGYDEEVAAFLGALRDGGEPPIPLRSLEATTRATFAIEESLRTGAPASCH